MRALIYALVVAACGCSKSDTDVDTDVDTDTDTDSVAPLADRITASGLMAHVNALGQIADDNGGHRSWASPGYAASVDYVEGVLSDAGYSVARDAHSGYSGNYVGDASLSQVTPTPTDYVFGGAETDPEVGFSLFTGSPGGQVSALVTAVDLMLPPGSANSSTSGCEAADFTGFPVGHIALMQRGTCPFSTKALRAAAAGASAALIFNEGQSGRTAVVTGYLEQASSIPVVGLGFALGSELASVAEAGDLEMAMDIDAQMVTGLTNVLATTEAGPEDSVILIGGHLDSVRIGPGINDNASGVALMLELATHLAEMDPDLAHKVRFAFWDAEETGLNGAGYYWEDLPAADKANTSIYFNYDMVGSINGLHGTYRGEGGLTDAYPDQPHYAATIEDTSHAWFAAQGLASETYEIPAWAGLDSMVFASDGLATPGLFSGALELKTTAQASAYGGTANEPYDPCYHKSCDATDNIDEQILERMAKAAAHTLQSVMLDPNAFASDDDSSERRMADPTVRALGDGHATCMTELPSR